MAAGLAALNQRFGQALRAWARRRQGIDPPDLALESRRIYILPTRAGVIFAVITFVMLLGAMNYNNNLGFALTFLLAAVGIVSIHHCHHNLAQLRISALGAEPVFAGDCWQFRFALSNARPRPRWQMRVSWDGETGENCADLRADGQVVMELPLAAPRRGGGPPASLRWVPGQVPRRGELLSPHGHASGVRRPSRRLRDLRVLPALERRGGPGVARHRDRGV